MRESYKQVLESANKDSPSYQSALEKLENEPSVPFCAEHLWNWFWELHSTRSAGMNGPDPISYLEIDAWEKKTGKIVHPFEVKIIKDLDAAYINFSHKERRKKQEKNKGKK